MTTEEIKKEIAACEERLKSLREGLDKSEYGGKRWKPKAGDLYWYILDGGLYTTVWDDDCGDNKYFAVGNVFPSGEAAEFEVERRKVIAELSDYAEDDKARWNSDIIHWYLYYNRPYGVVDTDCVVNNCCGELYFPSQEAVDAAIEAVGEERIKKYYLGIK